MNKILLIIPLFLIKAPTWAQQCNTFECAYQKAEQILNTSKAKDKYEKVLANLDDAENFAGNDQAKRGKVRALRKKAFVAIQKEKEDAENQKTLAELEKIRADSLSMEARKQTRKAEAEKIRADSALAKAEWERQNAQNAAEDAIEQGKKVEELSRVIVRYLVQKANEHIYHLQYDSAASILIEAQRLNLEKSTIGQTWLEIAFWRIEIGRYVEAESAVQFATQCFEKETSVLQDNVEKNRRRNLLAAIENLDNGRLNELRSRYYPTMIDLPGNTFQMGCNPKFDFACFSDEIPIHEVILSPFRIAKTETTNWQFGLFREATRNFWGGNAPSWGLDGDNPVVSVSYRDALNYAKWLNSRLSLSDNSKFRLPTEAEWEFAARGNELNWYSGSMSYQDVAWFGPNSDSRTHAVAIKKPNAFGLFDMSGNANEWCADYYDEQYYKQFRSSKAENPQGPTSGATNVVRGGSIGIDDAQQFRVTARFNAEKNSMSVDLGFRLAQGF